MPPMCAALVKDLERTGPIDDYIISTTRLVDKQDMDVWFIVFEFRSGWKSWFLGYSSVFGFVQVKQIVFAF